MEIEEKISKLHEIVNELQKEGKPVFTIRDAVLILLYAQKDQPIYSRRVLFNELFLLHEKILREHDNLFILQIPTWEFDKKHGVYSDIVDEVVKQLYWSGFINVVGRRGSRLERFELTAKGIEEAKKRETPHGVKFVANFFYRFFKK